MPPAPPSTGSNPRPAPAVNTQIASSNATANAFLGGRQPSWMTPGAKVTKPVSRPAARRPPVAHAAQPQPQPQPQPQQQPVVLPSPAPSDEPSPALSSVLDSPKPGTVSLADALNMGSTSISIPASLPVTDARFVNEPSDRPGAQDVPRPMTVGSLLHDETRSAASGRVAQSLNNNGPLDGQGGHNRSIGSEGAPTSTASPGSGPPLKRRRTDQTLSAAVTCTSLLPILEQYLQSCGGAQALDFNVERPRIMLLRDACQREDEFFVVLHQLFCMWSLNPSDAYACLPIDRATIDRAFIILESVLKKNQSISPAHQQWLSRFPVPAGQFSRGHIGGAAVVMALATFLNALVAEHEQLLTACIRRRYPFLVDELLGRLRCLSPVLQFILFTSCRRRLGVPDDDLGNRMEQAFREDQNRHRNSIAGLQDLESVTPPGEMEQRNGPLISFYQVMVATAASRSAGQPAFRSPSISSTPTLQHAGGTARSPSSQRAQQHPTMQYAQQHQAASAPYTMPNAASPVYTSSTPVQPSQLQTTTVTPYITSPGANRVGTTQAALPSANMPQTSQRRQTRPIAPSPTQPQVRAMVNIVPSQQPPVLPSQHLFHQQQALAQRQQLLSPQQFNQQQYQRNLQAAMISPTQSAFQAGTQLPTGAPQVSRGAQPAPNIWPQQMPYNLWVPEIQPVVSPRGIVANGGQLGPTPAAQPTAQQASQGAPQRQRPGTVKDPLLPPQGVVLGRPDWPYDPADRKAILMSLHQAHVRSPKRVIKGGSTERYYQAVKSLPVGPVPVVPKKTMYEFRFEVTEEQFVLAAAKSTAPKALIPVVEHFNGSLRWRVRCCAVPSSLRTPSEAEWVTLDVSWPSYIHMTLNDKVLHVRRQPHNGKDLSTEITDFIVRGTNVLMVAIHDSLQSETHKNRHLAVEMLETLSHSTVVNAIWEKGPVPEEDTLNTIKKRLTSSDDDEVTFHAPDLAIDLADPFSATIFEVPARGATCSHMECFDLENWLTTRPSKPPPAKCPHKQVPCTCPSPAEPSNPDKWRCPICSRDARPYSLRIDGFLLGVRAQLEEEGKLRAKSLRVKADGSWSVVVEADDEGEEDDDDGEGKKPAAVKVAVAQAPVPTRREVEVIELD